MPRKKGDKKPKKQIDLTDDINESLIKGNLQGIDLVQLDSVIKNRLEWNTDTINDYKQRIDAIDDLFTEDEESEYEMFTDSKRESLKLKKIELEEKINDIQTSTKLAEYICKSQDLLSKYVSVSSVPISRSFINKESNKERLHNEKEKADITDKFLEMASVFIPINMYKPQKENVSVCSNCNENVFEKASGCIVCRNCGQEKSSLNKDYKFTDSTRINIHTKYKYDRKSHFRDAINQYQGKQNKRIDKKVFSDVDEQFYLHNLLEYSDEMEEQKHKIFVYLAEPVKKNAVEEGILAKFYEFHSQITKEHIYMFLSETKNNKHYEDVNLIHQRFTGIPCADISHLEDILFKDFEAFENVFETFDDIDRSSFLNGQYVLYQFLRRHKFKCEESDFSILRTRERLVDHDEIYGRVCHVLEWNYLRLAG